MKRFAQLLLSLPLLLAAPASAKDLLDYEWFEVRTPHFVIASALKPEKSLELAVDLENFRTMVERVTDIGRFEERIPTQIYLLPGIDRDLGLGRDRLGYFRPGMRANYALMRASGHSSDETLKHEYVHFLVHNRDEILYPLWFDEGFAELLSTLKVTGTTFEYGKANGALMSWLVNGHWLPARTLLGARDVGDLDGDEIAMFYAQSWLLVHFLNVAHGSFSERGTEFLKRRERGEANDEAFEGAFGIPADALASTLRGYLRKSRYYRAKLREPLPAVETKTRPLARAVIAAKLGTIALLSKGPEAAEPFYRAALDADPNHGPALTGVGDIHKFAHRFDEAQPHYEKAIALEPANDNHELDYAEYFLDRARHEQREGASAERVAELLVEARRHFMRAYKLNPDNPETLAMNGATYLVDGADAAKGVESLEAAHQLLPSQTDIRMLLAQAYLAADQREKARSQLETLLAWAHSSDAEQIQQLLAALDEQPATEASVTPDGNLPAK